DFRGRLSGSNEEKELAQQIAGLFKKWKLTPIISNGKSQSFIQSFEIITGTKLSGTNNFFLNNKPLLSEKEYRPLSLSQSGSFKSEAMSFVGYGIKAPATDKFATYDSYEKVDIKNKWAVMFKDLPSKIDKNYRNHLLPFARLAHKITLAQKLGAHGVIFIDSTDLSTKAYLSKMKYEGAPTNLPVIEITLEKFLSAFNLTESQYTKIKETLESNQPLESLGETCFAKGEINLQLDKKMASQIIGMIPAAKTADRKLKSIIIGAHMDHLGQGEIGNSLATTQEQSTIHFGADDNASGDTGVLELAHYFSAHRNKLKRNIYFALWSAEEMGVLGSHYFTEDWEKTKNRKINQDFWFALNMDMIGRFKDKLYIQGVGSSKGWTHIIEPIAVKNQIPISIQYDPYLPTDSISFYLKEIPAINFFTGVHSDYHTPRDTADKINFDGLAGIINLVKDFTEQTLITPEKEITYEKVEGSSKIKEGGRSFRIYLGTIPDYSQEGVKGVRISGVSKNSPAEKAGLQAKDIIVEFNGQPVDSINDYVFGLQTAVPKKEIAIKIMRANELVTLKITPELKQ
ncbi:MAG: M20/M25/M40 family metallo-hydrolase, partial [Bdellovibrionales bacterium]|nr:M20/M25/M40 family metallo-hydrolase [Bdellovibrionales bacterium]